MLSQLWKWFKGDTTGSTFDYEVVVPLMAAFIEEMFTSEELAKEGTCIRALKTIGDTAVEEFRKEMLQDTVVGIVQSDNVVLSLCKALFSNIENHCLYQAIFSEGIAPRRQVIYDHFNEKIEDPALKWTDELIVSIDAWTGCRLFCLRYLEELILGKEDWWDSYLEVQKTFTENFFDVILDHAEGKEYSPLGPLMKPLNDAQTRYKEKILKQASEFTGNPSISTKRCPFCAEEILEEAVACIHCGRIV